MKNNKFIELRGYEFSPDMSIFDTFRVVEKYTRIEVSRPNISVEKLFMIGGAHGIKKLTIPDESGRLRTVRTNNNNEIIYWKEKLKNGEESTVVLVGNIAVRVIRTSICAYHNSKFKLDALEIANEHLNLTITGDEEEVYCIPDSKMDTSPFSTVDGIGFETPIQWIDEHNFKVGNVHGRYIDLEQGEYALMVVKRYTLSFEMYFSTYRLINKKTEKIVEDTYGLVDVKDLGKINKNLEGLYIIDVEPGPFERSQMLVDLRNNKVLLKERDKITVEKDIIRVEKNGTRKYKFTSDRDLRIAD